jgi:hypothetical protein
MAESMGTFMRKSMARPGRIKLLLHANPARSAEGGLGV